VFGVGVAALAIAAASMAATSIGACSHRKAAESPEGSARADAGSPVADIPPAPVTVSSSAAAGAETLFVRGALADGQAEGPRTCLAVRSSVGEAWRNLYAPIEGFSHDPAFDYELRVELIQVPDAPADAPSSRYRLIEVVSKRPAAP
jgi:hypothetical protein